MGTFSEHHRKKQLETENQKEKERQENLRAMGMGMGGPYARRGPVPYMTRTPTPRHQPYTLPRPARKPSTEFQQQGALQADQSISESFQDNQNNMSNNSIKQESIEGENSEKTGFMSGNDPDQSNSSSSMPNENFGGGTGSLQGDSDEVNVKQEATDSEFDLQITGVELGMPGSSQETWAANVAMGMGFDQSGATGSPGDMSQEGFSK